MNLSELREYVRDQTQTTEGELPNATVDRFLQEAFDRTIAMENQWPFLEKSWELLQLTGTTTVAVPGDMNTPALVGIYSRLDQQRIELIQHDKALELWGEVESSYTYDRFSVWAGEIHFWPKTPQPEDRTYTAIGFRLPTDWIAAGPLSEPDCDRRLHQPLAHYAVALAYAQQEDEQLEGQYMKRWEIDSMTARSAIMEPAQDRPLIMGPHLIARIGPPGIGRGVSL